jgi:hypothetical protein
MNPVTVIQELKMNAHSVQSTLGREVTGTRLLTAISREELKLLVVSSVKFSGPRIFSPVGARTGGIVASQEEKTTFETIISLSV